MIVDFQYLLRPSGDIQIFNSMIYLLTRPNGVRCMTITCRMSRAALRAYI